MTSSGNCVNSHFMSLQKSCLSLFPPSPSSSTSFPGLSFQGFKPLNIAFSGYPGYESRPFLVTLLDGDSRTSLFKILALSSNLENAESPGKRKVNGVRISCGNRKRQWTHGNVIIQYALLVPSLLLSPKHGHTNAHAHTHLSVLVQYLLQRVI